jgi:hypothetical protein
MALHVFVIKETELEGPQDLRARSRKFLNLTNERKNMSTKTNFKRVALVAVASLGLGVLTSVAPANAADWIAADLDFTAAAAQPGVCSVTNGTTAGTTSAVVVAGSRINVEAAAATGSAYVSISGNATIESAGTGYEAVTLTTLSSADAIATTSTVSDFVVRAGAVGSAVIYYSSSSTAASVDALSITIVAACTNRAYSGTYSFYKAVDAATAVSGFTLADNIDATGATTVTTTEGSGYMIAQLRDAYNGTLSSKAVVATVTKGEAYVNVADAAGSAPAAGSAKTAVVPSTGDELAVRVTPITAGTPTVATVELAYNGVVVATKSFTFQGYADSIVVTDVTVGSLGTDALSGTGKGYFRYQVKDSAGNALYSRAIANDTTANAVTSISSITTGISVAGTTSSTGGKSPAVTEASPASYACVDVGATKINVQYIDPNNITKTVKASFNILCSDVLDTWTASMDKASYSPGEIATLTISGKDENGLAVGSLQAIGTVTYSFGGLGLPVTAPTPTDTFASGAGIKTYQFPVGTTEGSFVGTFQIAGDTDTTAKTLQYKVASTSTAVSMADVLKAIVSLIASINKQIAALQKALLKK